VVKPRLVFGKKGKAKGNEFNLRIPVPIGIIREKFRYINQFAFAHVKGNFFGFKMRSALQHISEIVHIGSCPLMGLGAVRPCIFVKKELL
jgi:hypothetical protein